MLVLLKHIGKRQLPLSTCSLLEGVIVKLSGSNNAFETHCNASVIRHSSIVWMLTSSTAHILELCCMSCRMC